MQFGICIRYTLLYLSLLTYACVPCLSRVILLPQPRQHVDTFGCIFFERFLAIFWAYQLLTSAYSALIEASFTLIRPILALQTSTSWSGRFSHSRPWLYAGQNVYVYVLVRGRTPENLFIAYTILKNTPSNRYWQDLAGILRYTFVRQQPGIAGRARSTSKYTKVIHNDI